MKIEVIASTKPGEITKKEDFDLFSGKCAGVCYMVDSFEALLDEPEEKTRKRILRTQKGGHHSVFDHNYVTLYLEGIPKLLAMLINNEKMYTTSEKSARYTKMKMEGKEKELYDKWASIFYNEINKAYPEMEKRKIEKLAQENARYLISVMTETTMVYTVSYRQLNYLYGFCKNFIEDQTEGVLQEKLKPAVEGFMKELEKLGYLEENLLSDHKSRRFSLIGNTKNRVEYFGDVYCTNYLASFAELAQAQRHRTLSYTISMPKETKFYLPPIIKENQELAKQWLQDIQSVSDHIPQGMLIEVNERGTYENFILKLKERLCSAAQLEICDISKEVLTKYANSLKQSNHPLAEEIQNYTKGARCTFKDFECKERCNFKEGITLTRRI